MIFYTVVKKIALQPQKAVNKMGRGEVNENIKMQIVKMAKISEAFNCNRKVYFTLYTNVPYFPTHHF